MKQKREYRRRLSDKELEFYETTIASACGIITNMNVLGYWIDQDKEQIKRAEDIIREAESIRMAAIEWMKKRKDEQ